MSPVAAAGGRITGCSARPVSQQAGSHKVGGVGAGMGGVCFAEGLCVCMCVVGGRAQPEPAPQWCHSGAYMM